MGTGKDLRALTLIFVCAGTIAQAGAWMRAEGTGFLSLTTGTTAAGDLDGSIYTEYGLGPRLTLGVHVDVNMPYRQTPGGTGRAFFRMPIGAQKGPNVFAYEFGIGARRADGAFAGLASLGLSYGRGISLGQRSGWLAIDGRADLPLGDGETVRKLDATLGLSLGDRSRAMMQVFVTQNEAGTSTTLAPAFLWQRDRKRPTWLIGVEAQDGEVALKIGIWREF